MITVEYIDKNEARHSGVLKFQRPRDGELPKFKISSSFRLVSSDKIVSVEDDSGIIKSINNILNRDGERYIIFFDDLKKVVRIGSCGRYGKNIEEFMKSINRLSGVRMLVFDTLSCDYVKT